MVYIDKKIAEKQQAVNEHDGYRDHQKEHHIEHAAQHRYSNLECDHFE